MIEVKKTRAVSVKQDREETESTIQYFWIVTPDEVKETWQKQSDDKTKSGTKRPAC